jgi:hypothetical protein
MGWIFGLLLHHWQLLWPVNGLLELILAAADFEVNV